MEKGWQDVANLQCHFCKQRLFWVCWYTGTQEDHRRDHVQALLVFFYKSCANRGINASQVWPCAFLAHPPNAGNYSDNKYFCACCGGVL